MLNLERGKVQRLTGDAGNAGNSPKVAGRRAGHVSPPNVACTLPEVFAQVCVGERIWFDDGRIGGVIRHTGRDWLELEITHARALA